MSKQLAHGTPDGQVMTPKWALTLSVENVETSLVPDGARSSHVLNPIE
jgi:hypothetical protein